MYIKIIYSPLIIEVYKEGCSKNYMVNDYSLGWTISEHKYNTSVQVTYMGCM